MRTIVGIILSIIGVYMTIYSEWLYQNFGTVDVAERWFGSDGGSRLFYKFVGILVTLAGFLMVTGLMGKLVLWIFIPLFTGFQQSAPAP